MNLALYGVDIWSTALVFARVGAMIMLLPGVGEPAIPARVRLGFALAVAMAIAPPLASHAPQPANTALGMAGQVGLEALIGLIFGGAARMLMSAVATAGQIAATESGIAFAQVADPMSEAQSGQLLSVFLSVMGVALIFATGLDRMFLQGIAGSYELLAPGARAPVGDAAQLALDAAASSFRVGFQIAMPVIAAGMIFRVGLGILARLIPQIQVFFVALPLQVMGGFAVLALGLSAGMLVWLDSLQTYSSWLR
jgi:flagellar biosynthetic protein FliR